MADREKDGRFASGNKIWLTRSSHGRNPKFNNADDLWDACCEYFEWVNDNPLLEEKGFAFQGAVTKEKFGKMRAMTIASLCLFLDITERAWRHWRDETSDYYRPDLLPVITRVEAVIFAQKFEGAAADLLNPNIIARDLGLADRKELTGAGGGPIKTESMTADADEFARAMASLAAAAHSGETPIDPDDGGEG